MEARAHAAAGRRREAAFNQFSAQITRELRDEASLQAAARRVLNAAEVRADPELDALLRSFIAGELSRLRQASEPRAEPPAGAPAASGGPPAEGPAAPEPVTEPSPGQVRGALARLEHEFEDAIDHLDEGLAHAHLTSARELLARYPQLVPPEAVDRLAKRRAALGTRVAALRERLARLADRAVVAAARGAHEQAAEALKRLSTIHASRPALLPEGEFAAIRARMMAASDAHDHRLAAAALVQRERAVAAEIKSLAETVQAFYVASRSRPHDDLDYLQAEAEYHRAVAAIRSHDREWLAALILELDTWLDEIRDPTHRSEEQVDRFLASVRRALAALRKQVGAAAEASADG